jgi:hypothetical protein
VDSSCPQLAQYSRLCSVAITEYASLLCRIASHVDKYPPTINTITATIDIAASQVMTPQRAFNTLEPMRYTAPIQTRIKPSETPRLLREDAVDLSASCTRNVSRSVSELILHFSEAQALEIGGKKAFNPEPNSPHSTISSLLFTVRTPRYEGTNYHRVAQAANGQ